VSLYQYRLYYYVKRPAVATGSVRGNHLYSECFADAQLVIIVSALYFIIDPY
jgi:hypothetical protein